MTTTKDKEDYCKEPVNTFYKDAYYKAYNITKKYSRKLIVTAKNGAKQRMDEAAVKVKQICENLKRRTTDEHFDLIDRTAEKSKEKEFTK